jgi:hypothetical protein
LNAKLGSLVWCLGRWALSQLSYISFRWCLSLAAFSPFSRQRNTRRII